jgi:cytochrome c oxidase cbb3-type subunit 3
MPGPLTAVPAEMISRALNVVLMLALLAIAIAWFRGERHLRPATSGGEQPLESLSLSALHPGGSTSPEPAQSPEYEETAYAISQGAQLYRNYNCNGCHHNGGGGIGPALMDDKWLYGSAPRAIVDSIVQGRPNGMPAFRGKLNDQQLQQLAAYVRSMSGLVPASVRASREDHLHATPPRTQTPPSPPLQGGRVPPTSERPQ